MYIYMFGSAVLFGSQMLHVGLCCGYCAISQGSLDRFEVDPSARPASSLEVICVLSVFILLTDTARW